MISKEEIKKLADLARIEIKEEEQEKLALEMEAILGYVSQVSHFALASRDEFDENQIRNVMRADENPNESGTYSQALIAEFPNKEGDYLKVKKIL